MVLAMLLPTSFASAEPQKPAYAGLFVDGATWTMPCTRRGTLPVRPPTSDGSLECKVSEVLSIGKATLAHLVCSGNTANPEGWYAMIDRGFYRLESADVGPARPRARWTDFEAPQGTFQASDVKSLRALRPWMPKRVSAASWKDPPHPSGWTGDGTNFRSNGAWCAQAHGSNGGGGESRTICFDRAGLAGTGWSTGESGYAWECGVMSQP